MDQQILGNITLFLTMFTAIAAAVSAFVAARQASAAANSNTLQLFMHFRERYAREEVNKALSDLHFWFSEHGDESARKWHKLFLAKDPHALELNSARRMIHAYFRDLAVCHSVHGMKRHLISASMTGAAYKAFKEVCLPMGYELYDDVWRLRQERLFAEIHAIAKKGFEGIPN